jgi:hypothetical protein
MNSILHNWHLHVLVCGRLKLHCKKCRPYRRVHRLDETTSFTTSAARTDALSIFSTFTLENISAYSVIAIPLDIREIKNVDSYTSGEQQSLGQLAEPKTGTAASLRRDSRMHSGRPLIPSPHG